MHNAASLATPGFHWFTATHNSRTSRPWAVYPMEFYAIQVPVKETGVFVSSGGAALFAPSVVAATKSPNILELDALTTKISQGGKPILSVEFRGVAEAALAANTGDRSSIVDWAKKLADSTFDH